MISSYIISSFIFTTAAERSQVCAGLDISSIFVKTVEEVIPSHCKRSALSFFSFQINDQISGLDVSADYVYCFFYLQWHGEGKEVDGSLVAS